MGWADFLENHYINLHLFLHFHFGMYFNYLAPSPLGREPFIILFRAQISSKVVCLGSGGGGGRRGGGGRGAGGRGEDWEDITDFDQVSCFSSPSFLFWGGSVNSCACPWGFSIAHLGFHFLIFAKSVTTHPSAFIFQCLLHLRLFQLFLFLISDGFFSYPFISA